MQLCRITGYLRKQQRKIAVAKQFVTVCARVFVSLRCPSYSLPRPPPLAHPPSLSISSFLDKRHFFRKQFFFLILRFFRALSAATFVDNLAARCRHWGDSARTNTQNLINLAAWAAKPDQHSPNIRRCN